MERIEQFTLYNGMKVWAVMVAGEAKTVHATKEEAQTALREASIAEMMPDLTSVQWNP
jgi:hypothetical protein